MKKGLSLSLLAASVLLLAAAMTGCGGSTQVQSATLTTTPATSTSTSTETTTHLFAYLRADATAAPVSAQQLQAARRAAKTDHATIRQAPVTGTPAAANIYVWPFLDEGSGWKPGAERKITASPGPYTSVHLSSNDTTLVFTAVVNGYNQIFTSTVPVEGQTMPQPIQLTTDMEHHWVPHVSSDGSKVLFTKFDPGSNGDVVCFINNAVGASETCLSFSSSSPVLSGANLWHAVWAPNGKIFFEAWGGPLKSDDIFMADGDGSGLTQITNNAGTSNYDECPSVYGDGTSFVVDTWNNLAQFYEITWINVSTKARQTHTSGVFTHGDAWDPLATYFTIVWVSQLGTDSSPQLYVDAAWDDVRLTGNFNANYFENTPR